MADKNSELNRRKFMEIGIYAISGTIATVSTVALGAFAVGPSFRKVKSKWIKISSDEVPVDATAFTRVVLEYENKDGWLTSTERALVYVKRIKEDEIIAISAGCTHLGCIVTWKEDQKIFQCPCHDGRYDSDGNVVSGPPPAPLKRHKTRFEDGQILIATETIPYEGHQRV